MRTDDGLLSVKLSLPPTLGGTSGATNPEQLFVAGYAACFGNAVILMTQARAVRVKDDDIHVTAEVGVGPDTKGGFALSIALDVLIFGQTLKRQRRLSEQHTSSAPTRTPSRATSR